MSVLTWCTGTDDPPKIRAALKPEEVDILSAYSPEQGGLLSRAVLQAFACCDVYRMYVYRLTLTWTPLKPSP